MIIIVESLKDNRIAIERHRFEDILKEIADLANENAELKAENEKLKDINAQLSHFNSPKIEALEKEKLQLSEAVIKLFIAANR